MPAKRCIETKNMRLLFVDYCKKESYIQKKKQNGAGRKETEYGSL